MVLTEDEMVIEEASPREYNSYDQSPCMPIRFVQEQWLDDMVRLICKVGIVLCQSEVYLWSVD